VKPHVHGLLGAMKEVNKTGKGSDWGNKIYNLHLTNQHPALF